MRIAVSGTHYIGKSTLIEDFIKKHPEYTSVIEPYYKLQNEKSMELSLEPSLDSLIEQLDYSINQLNEHAKRYALKTATIYKTHLIDSTG